VAGSVLTLLSDRQWAESIYTKADAGCSDRDHYYKLMTSVWNQTHDKDLLKQMHRSAEDKLNTTSDLVYLAESILKYFSDTGWATRVYGKAEQAMDIRAYGYELAKSLADKLGDRKWARRVRQI
jgi:hypothetical protein